MPTRAIRPEDTDAVPIEYSGKWIAWDSQLKHIVATAESMTALWQLVKDKRIENPVFEKVPRAACSVRGDAMRFPYRKYISSFPGSTDFRLILRPIINIRVASEHAEGHWEALVDTGADETLLPIAFAELLRIDLDEQLTSEAAGISGDVLQIQYGEVEIGVGDGEESVAWKEIVGFVDFGTDQEVIVLGHGGFLDYFTATFDGEREELELVPNSLLPPRTK